MLLMPIKHFTAPPPPPPQEIALKYTRTTKPNTTSKRAFINFDFRVEPKIPTLFPDAF